MDHRAKVTVPSFAEDRADQVHQTGVLDVAVGRTIHIHEAERFDCDKVGVDLCPREEVLNNGLSFRSCFR